MRMPLEADSATAAWTRFADGSPELAAQRSLGELLGVELSSRRVVTGEGVRVEVEGIDPEDRVIAQFVMNSGALKSAYRNKVSADLFKLVWLRGSLFPAARAVLCVSPEVGAVFAPSGWVATAARDLEVDVLQLHDGALTRLGSRGDEPRDPA